jgi:hypothetical protein
LSNNRFALSRFDLNRKETMIDTTDIKRDIELLANRLGKTQDYL